MNSRVRIRTRCNHTKFHDDCLNCQTLGFDGDPEPIKHMEFQDGEVFVFVDWDGKGDQTVFERRGARWHGMTWLAPFEPAVAGGSAMTGREF